MPHLSFWGVCLLLWLTELTGGYWHFIEGFEAGKRLGMGGLLTTRSSDTGRWTFWCIFWGQVGCSGSFMWGGEGGSCWLVIGDGRWWIYETWLLWGPFLKLLNMKHLNISGFTQWTALLMLRSSPEALITTGEKCWYELKRDLAVQCVSSGYNAHIGSILPDQIVSYSSKKLWQADRSRSSRHCGKRGHGKGSRKKQGFWCTVMVQKETYLNWSYDVCLHLVSQLEHFLLLFVHYLFVFCLHPQLSTKPTDEVHFGATRGGLSGHSHVTPACSHTCTCSHALHMHD